MFYSHYRFGTLGFALKPSVVIDCYYFCPDVGFKKHKNKLKEIGKVFYFSQFFLLPVLGLLEQYMTPTLDAALLCSSRAGADLGRKSDRFEELCQLGFPHSQER